MSKHLCRTLGLLLCLFSGSALGAGQIDLSSMLITDNSVQITLDLAGQTEAGVTALDFDLHYDPAVLTPNTLTAAAQAASAGKVVAGAVQEPGVYRVLLYGLGSEELQAGAVATLSFSRAPEHSVSATALEVHNLTLAAVDTAQYPHGLESNDAVFSVPLSQGETNIPPTPDDSSAAPPEESPAPPADDGEESPGNAIAPGVEEPDLTAPDLENARNLGNIPSPRIRVRQEAVAQAEGGTALEQRLADASARMLQARETLDKSPLNSVDSESKDGDSGRDGGENRGEDSSADWTIDNKSMTLEKGVDQPLDKGDEKKDNRSIRLPVTWVIAGILSLLLLVGAARKIV